MTWMEKLHLTVQRRATWPLVKMFFNAAKAPAPASHIQSVQERYPFLPESYLTMLSGFDGLDIEWFVFFGSGASKYPSTAQICKRWCDRFDVVSSFPFAEDAGGNPLFLHADGTIHLHETDTINFQERLLCQNFDILMSDAFFGPRYTQMLHGRNWKPTDDESWVGYLKKSGWY
jgi:hypothetical protein